MFSFILVVFSTFPPKAPMAAPAGQQERAAWRAGSGSAASPSSGDPKAPHHPASRRPHGERHSAARPHVPARAPRRRPDLRATSRHKPFAWSPWSLFFWDRPVLRVRDQEKKAPFRFLSLSSSPSSSFRDLPDFDFPLSCHRMENVVKTTGSHFKVTWTAKGS